MSQPAVPPSLAEYLTVSQAAKFLGVSPWTLRNWDRDGRLKSLRHPKNGYRIYRQLDLEAVLASDQVTGDGSVERATAAPRFHWSRASGHEHLVQFYEKDEFLTTSVAAFFASALRSGEACMMVATAAHRAAVEEALVAGGADLSAARARGQFLTFDAAETLASFMEDGRPNLERLRNTMTRVLRDARRGRPGLRVFGEMVALLWAQGNRAAAMQFEELWSELQARHRFTLYCAYPVNGFAGDACDDDDDRGGGGGAPGLGHVCAAHSRVIPSESYSALATPDERLRAITILQQKARALEAELARHQATARALADARAAADRANRAKDEFLAALSHELRAPLTPVLSGVQSLQCEPGLNDDAHATLEMIRRNVELEARLIDDLLDVSRVVNGKMVLHCQDTSVHPLIRHAVEMVAAEARDTGVALDLDLRASRDRVHGDPGRLRQVLWNLLTNAIKFTPRNGSVVLRTRDDAESGRIVIDVQDSGAGIEPDALATIFDAFDQGEHAGPRGAGLSFGGLGLGLAISKAVIDMHGGTIRAHSEGAGRGACFTIELATIAVALGDERTDPARQSEGRVDLQRTGRALRILLVDDHADTLTMLQRLLCGFGHTVTCAASVAQAMRAAGAAGGIDLLICDIGLPDGSGLDVVRELRARQPDVPAIALTGYGMEQDVRNSEQAGFAAHLTKPIDFAALRAAIERFTK